MILLDALSLTPTKSRPVWVMRQAGRYQASFRKMREKHTFDEVSLNPDLALKVTLAAIQEFDFDASIVFSDILYPLKAMGAKLEFTDKGPVLENPKTVTNLKKMVFWRITVRFIIFYINY
jgi:uroporphyrinogen decarboxylase